MIATGRQVAGILLKFVQLNWVGVNNLGEKGDRRSGRRVDNKKVVVRIDLNILDPQVEALLGDPTKAYKDLGWEPKET